MDDSYFNDDDFIFAKQIKQEEEISEEERFTSCEICGEVFEQEQYIDKRTNNLVYTKYKRCPECRQKITESPTTVSEKNVTIQYNPYEWQKRFHKSKARCKVISGAARSGKDRATTMEFINFFVSMLNEDRDYTYVPKVHRLDNSSNI